MAEPSNMLEKSPPGWEGAVERMKGHPEISNPFALAHWMAGRGYKPQKEDGAPYDVSALAKRARFEAGRKSPDGMRCQTGCDCRECGPATESISSSAMGAVLRPGARPQLRESDSSLHVKHDLTTFTCLREAAADQPTGTPRVVLMSAGPGNRMHGNFYPPEILQRDFKIFEGVKCFLDHPGALDEKNRPEREVESVAGWFSEVETAAIDGAPSIVANFNYLKLLNDDLTETGQKARGFVESALVYKRQYPGSSNVLLGFSINAGGPTHKEPSEDLARRYPQYAEALRGRSWWNVSDGIEIAQSVDLVTFPARGGRVLGLREAEACFDSRCWRARFDQALRKAA